MIGLVNRARRDVMAVWLRDCELAARAADFAKLGELQAQAPNEPGSAAYALFFAGRAAAGAADFSRAAGLFRQAREAANDQDASNLQAQCLVWEAYAEALIGNYAYARRLIKQAAAETTADSPLRAQIYFARFMVLSDSAPLNKAQRWLEKALNIAIASDDLWMQARCRANLAVVYQSQGMLDRAATNAHLVEKINSAPGMRPNQQQLMQVRNVLIHNLRWRGEIERALELAEETLTVGNTGGVLFRGWIALAAAMMEVERGNFVRAQLLWSQAHEYLAQVQDDNRTVAELWWEHAWLSLRRGDPNSSYEGDIKKALEMLNASMETEIFHAYVINALIARRRGDLSVMGLAMPAASDRFRTVGHNVALAGLLLHKADFYLECKRQEDALEALAEVLTIMRMHQLYGTYYWEPQVVARLCAYALDESIWRGQGSAIAARIGSTGEAAIYRKYEIEGGPEAAWAEFATSLALRRLAADYWQEFAPLLEHTAPIVRLRAARILCQAQTPLAQERLDLLRDDPDDTVRRFVRQGLEGSRPVQAVQIYSLGRFELLIQGKRPYFKQAGALKPLLLFGALLLEGENGMASAELKVLLTPGKSQQQQNAALYQAVWDLRRVLSAALDVAPLAVISAGFGRYRLQLPPEGIWWDLAELRRCAGRANLTAQQYAAVTLAQPEFMSGFFDLLPTTANRTAPEIERERIEGTLRNIATGYEEEIERLIAQVRRTDHAVLTRRDATQTQE